MLRGAPRGRLQLLGPSQGVHSTTCLTREPSLPLFALLLLYLRSNYCKPDLISYLINEYFALLLLIYLLLWDGTDIGSKR